MVDVWVVNELKLCLSLLIIAEHGLAIGAKEQLSTGLLSDKDKPVSG